jgi:RNA polymerase sigma factor (sigma-70 family)
LGHQKTHAASDPFGSSSVLEADSMNPTRPSAVTAESPSEPRLAADALSSLARAAAGGRADAVRTLIMSVTPAMLRAVRGVLGTAHPDVEDSAQEAVFRFVSALPGFRYECSVLHFACKVAVHTALNARRHARSRGAGKLDALDFGDHVSPGPSPAQELASAARREAVRQLFASLPTAQAEVFVMHIVLGFSVEETADACEVPANTVRSRLRLAKQAMRMRASAIPALSDVLEDEP